MEHITSIHKDMTHAMIRVEHNISKVLSMQYLHSHSYYELMFICNGSVTITSNNESQTLSEPSLVIHRPYMLHRANTQGKEPYERFIVYFNDEIMNTVVHWVPDFNKKFNGCMSWTCLSEQKAEDYKKRFSELAHCYSTCDIVRAGILLVLLIYDITAETQDGDIKFLNEKHSYIGDVMIYVNDNCESKEITVESIAKAFYISRTKLSSDFKNYTGMSVKQYILLAKIHLAKLLIESNKYTLSQIAQKCGFCDDSHFINTFRRIEGVTPKEYCAFLH